jgi:hypothetical protein
MLRNPNIIFGSIKQFFKNMMLTGALLERCHSSGCRNEILDAIRFGGTLWSELWRDRRKSDRSGEWSMMDKKWQKR